MFLPSFCYFFLVVETGGRCGAVLRLNLRIEGEAAILALNIMAVRMMLKIAARVVGSTAHLLAVVAAIVTPSSFYAIAKDCCAWPMD